MFEVSSNVDTLSIFVPKALKNEEEEEKKKEEEEKEEEEKKEKVKKEEEENKNKKKKKKKKLSYVQPFCCLTSGSSDFCATLYIIPTFRKHILSPKLWLMCSWIRFVSVLRCVLRNTVWV